jgi:transposase
MAKTRPPYPPEFRRQMVELVRAGRSPEELAQEFEPTAPSIGKWVGQAECGAGHTTVTGSGRQAPHRPQLHGREAQFAVGGRHHLHLSTWQSCWMRAAVGSSAGRWPRRPRRGPRYDDPTRPPTKPGQVQSIRSRHVFDKKCRSESIWN